MSWIWVVVMGAVAGWVGGKFLIPNQYGIRLDIIAGVIGAFLSALAVRVLSDGVGTVWNAEPIPVQRPQRRYERRCS